MANMIIVMIPLMIAAGVFTHITARHSVARQVASGQGMDNPQTAIMQKLMLYVFPIGVVVGAPFLPLAILIYWVSNNLWTLGQQYVVYRRIDVGAGGEEGAGRRQPAGARPAAGPEAGAPGAREAKADTRNRAAEPPAKKPGAKPVMRKQSPAATNGATPERRGEDGPRRTAREERPAKNGSNGSAGAGSSGAGATPGARRPRKRR